ncbi:MAG: hypothetical protein HY902_12505 [Deltaproteobacteria bacterium]|nr:hypothetical protein [Deltaproteobacteria bacterium]
MARNLRHCAWAILAIACTPDEGVVAGSVAAKADAKSLADAKADAKADSTAPVDPAAGRDVTATRDTAVEPPCPATGCDDLVSCTDDSVAADCSCVHAPRNGTCSDGDDCTASDHCQGGKCVGLAVAASLCDDQKPCTQDVCVTGKGCKHKLISGPPCTDGVECTVGDTCVNGACKAGPLVTCNCATDDDCIAQDDGNPCTGVLFCNTGAYPWTCNLKLGSIPNCKAAGPCLAALCDPADGACKQLPILEGQPCSDGSVCTEGYRCTSGDCVLALASACDDQNPCTNDGCDPSIGCVHAPTGNGLPCNAKGQVCTAGDMCTGGACVPGEPTDCSDGNACTGDTCVAGAGCQHAPINAPACSDGNACTLGDHCAGGLCAGASWQNCEDQDICTKDSCDASLGCLHVAMDSVGGCDDGNPCTSESCVAKAGCVYKPVAGACSDGKVCSVGDYCWLGQCAPGKGQVCNDGVACTADVCSEPLGCTYLPTDAKCNDGVTCTKDECSPPVGCVYLTANLPCSDGNVCTAGDMCKGLACLPGPATSCNDNNPCTTDSCSPTTGCSHTPTAMTSGCPDGCTPVPVDGLLLCFADFPWWGPRPDSPTTLAATPYGTIYDTQTHLDWYPLALPLSPSSYQQTVAACDALVYGGISKWRVPTAAEAESAARFDTLEAKTTFAPWFLPAKTEWLLTATTDAADPTRFWPISDLTGGFGETWNMVSSATWQVRCVH